MERKMYEVKITNIGGRKPCHFGTEPGTVWNTSEGLPGKMCPFAYNSFFPFIVALQTGGTFPWQEDPDVIRVCCPDPEVGNIFELRRIREK
jgi:uncharacterized repeat protein (TIGR04076 family)